MFGGICGYLNYILKYIAKKAEGYEVNREENKYVAEMKLLYFAYSL